jgi:hypothetical protein
VVANSSASRAFSLTDIGAGRADHRGPRQEGARRDRVGGAQKRDPAKMKFEIACGAVAYLRCKGKGSQSDLLTAACASIAAITLAQINDANAFTKEVRRVENLPDPGPGVSASVARSGKSRVPSEVPTSEKPANPRRRVNRPLEFF